MLTKNTDKSIQSKDKFINTFLSNYLYAQKYSYERQKKNEEKNQ